MSDRAAAGTYADISGAEMQVTKHDNNTKTTLPPSDETRENKRTYSNILGTQMQLPEPFTHTLAGVTTARVLVKVIKYCEGAKVNPNFTSTSSHQRFVRAWLRSTNISNELVPQVRKRP